MTTYYTISPIWGAGAQLFDNSGNVLTGGKIYTYLAGTTTPATTYTTKSGTVANSNPIIANAAGRLTDEIWLPVSQGFKFVLKDSNDVLIATYDNIPTNRQPPIVNDASSISYESGYEVTAGNFTIGETYLITSIGTTDFVAIGATENTPGILFVATGVGSGTGTAEYSRTLQTKLRESFSVSDFGAVGDGVADDTAAIQAAFTAAASSGATVLFQTAGASYLVTSPLTVGTNTKVIGNNCEIVYKRSDATNTNQIALGAGASWSDMTFTIPTSYVIQRFLSCDDDCVLTNITINSVDQQPLGDDNLDGCLRLLGDNVTVNGLKITNWDRSVFVYQSDNVSINNYYIQSYVLAINLRGVTNVRVTNGTIKTASPNASTIAGHNFILAGGSNITIDTLYGYQSGEHGIYCTNDTQLSGLKINNVILDKVGQCGIKIRNFSEVQIDGVTVVDCAYSSSTGTNEDGLRLEKVTNANISSYSVENSSKSNSCNDGIFIDGCQKIYITAFSVKTPKRASLRIEDTWLIANSEIYINGFTAIGCTGNDISVNTTATTTSNIVATGCMFLDTVGETIYWNTSATSGLLCFGGTAYQDNEDYIDNVSATTGIILNFVGASTIYGRQNRQVFTDYTNTKLDDTGSIGTAFLKNTGTDALNAYGASLSFGRIGGDRRGAGIAIKRTSNDKVNSFGLALLIQNQDSTSNDDVIEGAVLKASGTLYIPYLATYANNAAAVSGGLIAGDMYRTSTGEVRIVV